MGPFLKHGLRNLDLQHQFLFKRVLFLLWGICDKYLTTAMYNNKLLPNWEVKTIMMYIISQDSHLICILIYFVGVPTRLEGLRWLYSMSGSWWWQLAGSHQFSSTWPFITSRLQWPSSHDGHKRIFQEGESRSCKAS